MGLGGGLITNGVNYPMKNEVGKVAKGAGLGVAVPGWLGVALAFLDGGILEAGSAYFAKNIINSSRSATQGITSQIGGPSGTGQGSSPYGPWGG